MLYFLRVYFLSFLFIQSLEVNVDTVIEIPVYIISNIIIYADF